jgi:ATP-dependent DNA helicase PIF1
MDNFANTLQRLDKGKNLFITGNAGSGKSYLLRQLKEHFGKDLHLTATTGISALNIGGSTIHSWAKLGVGSYPAERIVHAIQKDSNAYERILTCKYLAIDEISMLSDRMLELLHRVLVLLRKNIKPFGGIQLLLFGDFLQLPPVLKNTEQLCLGSAVWKAAEIEVLLLTTNYRQKDDNTFYQVLSDIRKGRNIEESYNILTQRIGVKYPQDVIRLVSSREAAKSINDEFLQKLPGDSIFYKGKYEGESAEVIETYKSQFSDLENLSLKVGAKVMLNFNLNLKEGLINGLLGVVEGFANGNPVVKFENASVLEIKTKSWSIENDNEEVIFEFNQYPLQLAWATTIHKSQGCTFSSMHVDLSRCFAPGQAYVALSRVKSLDGLYLEPFSSSRIITDERLVAFYDYVENLAKQPNL